MINREELIKQATDVLEGQSTRGLSPETLIALATAKIALARELRESRAENSKTEEPLLTPPGMTFPPNPNGFIMRLEGPTGTGKSTLVAGLRDAGYEVTRMKHLHDAELYHVIPPPRTL